MNVKHGKNVNLITCSLMAHTSMTFLILSLVTAMTEFFCDIVDVDGLQYNKLERFALNNLFVY